MSDFHGELRGTLSPSAHARVKMILPSGPGELVGAGALISGGHAPIQVWEARSSMQFHMGTFERVMGNHFSLTLSS